MEASVGEGGADRPPAGPGGGRGRSGPGGLEGPGGGRGRGVRAGSVR
jgi:hypothetical protein